MTTGDNLTRLRKERGLTQKELSHASGITQPKIAAYENDKINLINASCSTVLALSNALGVTMEDILLGKEDREDIRLEKIKADIIQFIEGIK